MERDPLTVLLVPLLLVVAILAITGGVLAASWLLGGAWQTLH